jgi:hypothetical protein
MRKSFVIALGMVAALVVSSANAHATLLVAGATSEGQLFCAADNNVGCGFGTVLLDIDPTVGTLSLATAFVGGLTVSGSLHTQTTAPPENILNSSSLSIVNNTAASITVQTAVSATDFLGPASTAFTTGGGTWVNASGSLATYEWYNDPENTQGATDPSIRPGTLLDSFSDAAASGPLSFSHNGGPFAVNDPGLFSMTLGFDMILSPFGSMISRGQSEIKPATPTVPEPASMTLLSVMSLFGLAAFRRKSV